MNPVEMTAGRSGTVRKETDSNSQIKASRKKDRVGDIERRARKNQRHQDNQKR